MYILCRDISQLSSVDEERLYTVLLIQLDGNLASDVSTRCSGRPQGNATTRASGRNVGS